MELNNQTLLLYKLFWRTLVPFVWLLIPLFWTSTVMSALSLKQARMKPIYLFSATSAVLLQLAWCPIPLPLTCSSLYFRLWLFVHSWPLNQLTRFILFRKLSICLKKPSQNVDKTPFDASKLCMKNCLFPTSSMGTKFKGKCIFLQSANSLTLKFLWSS